MPKFLNGVSLERLCLEVQRMLTLIQVDGRLLALVHIILYQNVMLLHLPMCEKV